MSLYQVRVRETLITTDFINDETIDWGKAKDLALIKKQSCPNALLKRGKNRLSF